MKKFTLYQTFYNLNTIRKMHFTLNDFKLLSKEYKFDITEALQFLEEKKSKDISSKVIDKLIEESLHSLKNVKNVQNVKNGNEAKNDKQSLNLKRGPSGYNIFVKDQKTTFSEAGKRWRALSEQEKNKWISKAKSS